MTKQFRDDPANNSGRRIRATALTLRLCPVLFLATAAHAQVLYGSLTGTVSDPSGAHPVLQPQQFRQQDHLHSHRPYDILRPLQC